jgi:hypothetical protein
MRKTSGVRTTSPLHFELNAQLQPVMDDPRASAALAEGQAMEPLTAIRYALGESR